MNAWSVLGTLSAVPALDRPDLLGEPVVHALKLLDPADAALVGVAEIDPDLADTAAFCAAYSAPVETSANCVVVAGRRGEETRLAACVVLATTRADVNGLVRKRLAARRASFAPMDDAVALSGMEYGGITPVGLPAGWPLLVDGGRGGRARRRRGQRGAALEARPARRAPRGTARCRGRRGPRTVRRCRGIPAFARSGSG